MLMIVNSLHGVNSERFAAGGAAGRGPAVTPGARGARTPGARPPAPPAPGRHPRRGAVSTTSERLRTV